LEYNLDCTKKSKVPKTASSLLKMSERQVRRKLKIFIAEGPVGLAHGNRGKASSRKWDTTKEIFAISLLKDQWSGFWNYDSIRWFTA